MNGSWKPNKKLGAPTPDGQPSPVPPTNFPASPESSPEQVQANPRGEIACSSRVIEEEEKQRRKA